jgi:hypothetical protein
MPGIRNTGPNTLDEVPCRSKIVDRMLSNSCV